MEHNFICYQLPRNRNIMLIYYKKCSCSHHLFKGKAQKKVSYSVFRQRPKSLFGYVTLILNTIVARRCVIEVPKLFINLYDIVIKLLSVGSTFEYLLKLTCKFNVAVCKHEIRCQTLV